MVWKILHFSLFIFAEITPIGTYFTLHHSLMQTWLIDPREVRFCSCPVLIFISDLLLALALCAATSASVEPALKTSSIFLSLSPFVLFTKTIWLRLLIYNFCYWWWSPFFVIQPYYLFFSVKYLKVNIIQSRFKRPSLCPSVSSVTTISWPTFKRRFIAPSFCLAVSRWALECRPPPLISLTAVATVVRRIWKICSIPLYPREEPGL